MNKEIDKKLEALFSEADLIIEKEVIRLAKEVLKQNKKIDEFIMAMGSFFFTVKGKRSESVNSESEIEILKGGKELYDFVYKWDEQFKVTGNPMRFSLNSEITRDW